MTTERKPLFNLTVPIKCSTVKCAYSKADSVANGVGGTIGTIISAMFDNKIIARLMFYLFVAFGILVLSVIFFICGAIVIGGVVALATQNPMVSNNTMTYCGISGIVLGWIYVALDRGYIKVSCIKE